MKNLMFYLCFLISLQAFGQNTEKLPDIKPIVRLIFVCDKSGSMAGTRIKELNIAIQKFYENMKTERANQSLLVAFVAFNDTPQKIDFEKIETQSVAPQFKTHGSTNMAAALQTALDMIPQESRVKPIVILLTDGKPNPNTEQATLDIAKNLRNKAHFHALGVTKSDFNFLRSLVQSTQHARVLQETQFSDFFKSVKTGIIQYINAIPDPSRPTGKPNSAPPIFRIPNGDWEKK